jgi:hypothetical protein
MNVVHIIIVRISPKLNYKNLKSKDYAIILLNLCNCLAILKSLPTSLFQREETGVSPFEKGGLRGILP